MKYKLINNKTKEETLCDKVTIDGFDYYVGKSDIGIKDYFEVDGQILQCLTAQEEEDLAVSNDYPKVIATTNSKIDISKVVDEVEELAYIHYKSNQHYTTRDAYHFGLGYNKSQETHPFSEEDMIEFADWKVKNGFYMYSHENKWSVKSFSPYYTDANESLKVYTTKELLQLWKEQQPKIFYYE